MTGYHSFAPSSQRPWRWKAAGPSGERALLDPHHFIVCKDESVQNDYPAKAGDLYFDFLNTAELFARLGTVT
jgi:hypothetical protein